MQAYPHRHASAVSDSGKRQGAKTQRRQYNNAPQRRRERRVLSNESAGRDVQRANTQMQGRAETVPFDLRVTEVFQRVGEEWKLVHRHADPLISKSS
ncbi:MAG: nuclear transport factor 2 family protein [Chloroflexia bacterium]